MADAGLYNMAFGVETGDERLAREVKNDPRLSMATLIANTQAAQERGVSVAYNLLVGLPGQDWASILQTALLLRNHPPDRAGAADYSFYPGSHYYETLTKNGEASIKRYDGALAEIDMPHMTRGEILSAVTDLEVLFYYLRQAKAHPEAAETFLETLSWHVIDKLRIWTIYDLFLTSTATRDSRADLLRKLGKSADPILGQLLSERTKKTATFMAMAARMDEITLFEQYEQYSRAINLAPQVKGDYLDSFLTNISFVNALALIRLPFGVIRLWVMICMELYHSLKENDDLNIKSIELEDGKRGAALIQAKLLGKNTADLNRAQLTKGESVIEFMGIPFRLDRQEGRLVIPI